ncbi:MAG: hypothetical protein HY795_15650 [Desulfovibrio sp.]|nr:hypothetical protein [Desulfovibrio sp.]MBI4958744.1 hypothetical protein [Desulfovibrio sp.]
MAGPSLSNGLFDGNSVLLTPPLFRKLDILARTHARVPIQVYDWSDAPSMLAFVHPMVSGVRIKLGKRGCREMTVISLANRIHLEGFYSEDSGIDLQPVPPGDIYPFVVWREIMHVRSRDNVLIFDRDIPSGGVEFWAIQQFAEMRANLLAWKAMYPGSSPELSQRGLYFATEFEHICRPYAPALDRYANRAKRAPIPLARDEYVPVSHVEGIPWADEVRAVLPCELAA